MALTLWLLFTAMACATTKGVAAEAPLRCSPEARWGELFEQENRALAELQARRAGEARRLLGSALDVVLADLGTAFEQCAIGVAAAYRLLALAHIYDPGAQEASGFAGKAWHQALDAALRFQQLASAWLIYEYNNAADHDSGYIDSSAWPIDSATFDAEQQAVRLSIEEAMQLNATNAVPNQHRSVWELSKQHRVPGGLSLAIVTVCAYPEGTLLPDLAMSVHSIYATVHGYQYIVYTESPSSVRPPAWGKVHALREVVLQGLWEWVLWVDCDLFFMNLTTTIDYVLSRYASYSGAGSAEDGGSGDIPAQLLLSEDSQMLNTAFVLLRASPWSIDLLDRVWGPPDSPFTNHTWWEQAALAYQLLGKNHVRFQNVTYDAHAGMLGLAPGEAPGAYPPEVRVVPQFEVNSYHPISSHGGRVGDMWVPGRFALSFNGVQGLTSRTVASVLHATYYELFCELNQLRQISGACVHIVENSLAPWLGSNYGKS